jgi:hypothetical protein
MHILVGTWFVVSSNFPMWLKGDKTNPTFNYTLTEKKGKPVLLDEVRYMKNGRSRSIVGYDHPNPGNVHAFTWRGKGLLSIAKSKWMVVLMDEKEGWAVIHFSKTLFTPEGVDIISRKKDISENEVKKIKELMKQDAIVNKHLSSLKDL